MAQPAAETDKFVIEPDDVVSRVTEDVVCVSVPITFDVKTVNLYILFGEPLTLIDTGSRINYDVDDLAGALRQAGLEIPDIEQLILTHRHMDHFGLARDIKERSGCTIVASNVDGPFMAEWEGMILGSRDQLRRQGQAFGIPQELFVQAEKFGKAIVAAAQPVTSDRLVGEDDIVTAGSRDLRVIECPGHTEGLITFFDESDGTYLANDHVLRHITPNPDVYDYDPDHLRSGLPDYVDSLHKVRDLPARIVLPGHGHEMTDLAGRVDEILVHHDKRAERVRGWVSGTERTIYQVVGEEWPGLPPTSVHLAVREIIGHLVLLEGGQRGAAPLAGWGAPLLSHLMQGAPAAPPLKGLRVLDLCRLLPGDFATWVLADLGAEVIKVEDTAGGDYMRWTPPMVGHSSAMFWALNRGKRSIKLDLKQDAGRELFLRLVDTADALVESFRPGVMDRLGLGWETLSKRNPALVYCAITGYGQDGPYRLRAGHDLGYNSLAGLQGVTGTSSGEPAIPGFQVADLGAGGMGGALAVVAALLRRERDPERRGSFMDVSMFDGVSAFIAPTFWRALPGREEGAAGMHLNGRNPCYHLYRAADGRWMALAALEPKFWKAFCALVDRPDLADRAFDPEAIAEVEALFATRDRAAWLAFADGHDVMLEPVNNLAEAAEHPQTVARGLLVDAGGEIPQPAPVVRLPGGHRADTRVPAYGEDTEAVLGELGLGEAELDALRQTEVI